MHSVEAKQHQSALLAIRFCLKTINYTLLLSYYSYCSYCCSCALVFSFLTIITANITRYLAIRPPPASNDVILAPKTINPNCNKEKVVEEFKLYGKEYIWYKALIKTLKHIKQRTSHI